MTAVAAHAQGAPLASGDFDGDGKRDILLRNTNGSVALWFMSGSAIKGGAGLGTVGLDWTIAGLGDFDADGKADILWRNSSGAVSLWMMNGGVIKTGAGLGTVGLDWTLAGVGDFDGDGKSDILWRNSSGVVSLWLMNGGALKGGAGLGTVGLDWSVVGVGDFDGDGKSDILWRNSSGSVSLWMMNGSVIKAGGGAGTVGSDWTLAGTGDFDGDGRADILWRNSSGTVVLWFMNGSVVKGGGGAGTLGADWQIAGSVATATVSGTLGGSVSGLNASGLVLASGSDRLTIASGATSFTMPTRIAAGGAYAVTVQTQPSGQMCAVNNGSGTMPAGNVTSVAVSCSVNAYALGGSIAGLGSGSLVLSNNGVQITANAPATSFSFGAVLVAGSAYSVSIASAPSGYTCNVTNGSGVAGAASVSNVAIACSSASYRLGGSISGLNGSGLVLVNGSDTLSVASNATSFTMPASVAYQSSYNVRISSQPAGLNCSVNGGAGTMPAGNVTSVSVSCSGVVTSAGWTWMSGTQYLFVGGVYGTQGSAAPGNTPGGRVEPATWTDNAGYLWLYGGYGADASNSFGRLADLWKYDTGNGQWTWVGGSNSKDVYPSYGTRGVSSSSNTPGSRSAPSVWKDASGNVWLFGGVTVSMGYDSKNDLWKYQPSTNQWTWVAGTQTTDAGGVCGQQGVAASGNVPGARKSAASWIDGSGNLWVFGGVGYDCNGGVGHLNDLWKYDMSSGYWAWMSGPANAGGPGSYGTKGVGSTGNYPSSRQQMLSWADGAGNLWLFGGFGQDYGPNFTQGNCCGYGEFNDLWKYEPANGKWTWVGGSNIGEAWGSYGSQGVAADGNMPGARNNAPGAMDSGGNVWMFGGFGHDINGGRGLMNDVWKYTPSTNQWTWMAGSTTMRQSAIFGFQGVASGSNAPGARQQFGSWIDGSGHLWIFGGEGLDATGTYGQLNDMWKY